MAAPELSALIRTKLVRPRFDSASMVARQRLVRRLANHPPSVKLILFSAPAGCGKTTLVQEWLRSESTSVAWVTLDPRDNDIILFWRYLTTALIQTGILKEGHVSELLRVQPSPPIEEIISLLINDLVTANQDTSSPVYLILDDYQEIVNPAIHASLSHLLDYQPDSVCLVVATRSDPPFNLSRMRARREVVEIRAADLRFTPAEAEELLNGVLKLAMSLEDVKLLCQRTEGWAAGLQLAAISLREVDNPAQFVNQFAGDDRYIADYLVGEVLQRRDPETQRFLLETALLERFNAELCAAVTGRQDSQQLLSDLEHENIFLISLDQRREWYRYHRLFADLLLERLLEQRRPEEISDLYRKASRWHLQKNELEGAVEYALRGQDFELAINLLMEYGSIFFTGSQLTRLVALADHIPRNWQEKFPRFLMMMAWALLATGEYGAVEPNLRAVERALEIENQSIPPYGSELAATMDPLRLAALIEIAAVRANPVITPFAMENVLEWGQSVLPYLDRSEQIGLFNSPRDLMGPVQFMMGLVNKYLGATQDANLLFKSAAEDALRTKNGHILALAMANLAEVQILAGQLKSAEITCSLGLKQLENMNSQISPYAGGMENQLGKLAFERNILQSAELHFQNGCAAGKLWRHWDTLFDGCAGLVATRLALGDFLAAQQIVGELRLFLDQNSGQMMLPQVEFLQARIDLETGNETAFNHWAAQQGLEQLQQVPYLLEGWFLVYLHFLIRQKTWRKAAEKVRLVQDAVGSSGRQQVKLHLQIIEAVIAEGLGETARARQTMSQALDMGESLGFFRIFLDAGSPAASLIYACLEHGLAGGFAARLLEAFSEHQSPAGESHGHTGQSPVDLFEPLTSREMEVLALLADGMTNQEIGFRLSISLTTVKTHTRNLYAKLGVDSRSRAVAVARSLGILSG